MEYSELKTMKPDELQKIAKELGVDEKLKGNVLIEAIEKADIKRRLKVESEARAEIEVEAKKRLEEERKKLGISTVSTKCPETNGVETSKKVYATFINLENKDVEIKFYHGDKYFFHLFPDRVHVLPISLIKHLDTHCKMGKFKKIKDENGLEKSVSDGFTNRFLFSILGDAPKNAEFGVVLDDAILSKINEVKYE